MEQRLTPIEVYSPEYVRYVVESVKSNPRGFLKEARKRCTTVSKNELENSLRAWGIDWTRSRY